VGIQGWMERQKIKGAFPCVFDETKKSRRNETGESSGGGGKGLC
jgi:hypothetical protein